jgi:hypothetical protein
VRLDAVQASAIDPNLPTCGVSDLAAIQGIPVMVPTKLKEEALGVDPVDAAGYSTT